MPDNYCEDPRRKRKKAKEKPSLETESSGRTSKKTRRKNSEDVIEEIFQQMKINNEITDYIRTTNNRQYRYLDQEGIDFLIFYGEKTINLQAKSHYTERKMNRHFKIHRPNPIMFVEATAPLKNIKKAIYDFLARYKGECDNKLVYLVNGGVYYGYYNPECCTVFSQIY